jgi:tetratricopeptide (TPR) repeat protein
MKDAKPLKRLLVKPPAMSLSASLVAWLATVSTLAPLTIWTTCRSAMAQAQAQGMSSSSNDNEFLHFQEFPTHGRILFRIDPSVPVEWTDTPTGFTAFFKGSTLVDFGAAFGDEERWAATFANLHNPRLAQLRFREVSGGVRVEGVWKFPTGPRAPAEPRMETFNYRETQPPRFVVDFWAKPGMTVAELKSRQAESAKRLAARNVRDHVEKVASRRLASEKNRAEQDDPVRFCREPLKDDRDVFLPFHPVHEQIDFAKYLPLTPDQDFSYFRPKGEEADAQYVRLALDLYAEDKYALVLRTVEFLNTEHPHSPYRQEMAFLRANSLLKLGMVKGSSNEEHGSPTSVKEGEAALEAVRLDAKGTPESLHAALFLAARTLKKGSPLANVETFSWLIENYSGNRLAWMFHLAVAESLYSIEQTERAAKEYQWVAENAPEEDQRALAAFRIGDLYLSRWQYEQALGAYVRAIRYFPKQASRNAAVYLNRAESLIGLSEYEDAQEGFEHVLADFASYPEGWRASLRLGEIAGRKDGDAARQEARRRYYDTINRYPFSPGATLARLRLLPCDDHGGFTAESIVRFFDTEARTFDVASQIAPGAGSSAVSSASSSAKVASSASESVVMTRYPDLRAQTRVRTLIAFGKDEDAMTAIAQARPSVSSSAIQREFDHETETLFRRAVLARLHSGPKGIYDALAFYEAHRASVPGGAAEPDYLLELSHAASDLGLGKLAAELSESYRKASAGERSIASETAGGGDSELTGLERKLKISDGRFADAEALWISRPAESAKPPHELDERIRSELNQVVTESRFAFEKEVILGLLEEKNGKPASARAHAAKAELLAAGRDAARPKGSGAEAAKPSGELLRVRNWLATLETKTSSPGAALQLYREIEKAMPHVAPAEVGSPTRTNESDAKLTLLGMPALPTLEQILLAEAMILDRDARWGEAAATYGRAVDTGLGGNQAMYGLARAWLKTGVKASRKKALSLLEKVSASKSEDFWKDLAAKALEVERGSGNSR